ncbi:MAG: RDD family protein [Woeseiaceae bacterium]|nr:RDD family protein [Woeseiaceae bacterium]NIP20051.1 RDD family protein [Woeseiaceae bacterium]NIS88847.1 RDD family protein [Woeseiaceae bacterium]
MENASLLRRLGAMLYDSLLVLAILFLATLPFIAMRGGEPVEPNDNRTYQLTMLLVIYAFFVYFWSRSGQTLGMRSWRLRLETPSGSIPSVSQASLRFLMAIVSLVPFGLGFIWQLWDKDNLTWHDRASDTRLKYYPKT